MTVAFWILVLVAPAVAIGYVIWAYRSKTAAKAAASQERLAALIAMPQGPRAAAGAVLKEQTAPVVDTGPVAAQAGRIARHERFLSQPETLMYYLLKAALADHEIFPRVSLASVIETPENPFPPEQARRPAQDNFDFVVCNKSMRVVAVIRLHGSAAGPWADLVDRRLNAAGIKAVTVDPKALPRREQVRSLIFGQSA
jgi:hypothetical protein